MRPKSFLIHLTANDDDDDDDELYFSIYFHIINEYIYSVYVDVPRRLQS